MTAAKRLDAIGQEINIGDIVKPFAKSGHSVEIQVVTRFNPVMIQLNGRDNYEADRLVVVTENLINIGKSSVVDDLKKKYESVMTTEVKEVKIPSRYLVLGDPRSASPRAFVVHFGHTGIDQSRGIMQKHMQIGDYKPTHILKKKRDGSLFWSRVNGWDVTTSILAFRSLPDSVAQVVGEVGTVVEVLHNASVVDLDVSKY